MNWNDHLERYYPQDPNQKDTSGMVFDIQRFSIHDGDGIRTMVFLKGCPLECVWCQNPESISPDAQTVFIENNCIDCRKCLVLCGPKAISECSDKKRVIDRESCKLCSSCIEKCYADAINIIGRHLNVDEVLEIVERDREFYEKSGGGVTFSGGEPTSQPQFLAALCREAKQRNLHTCIETSAYCEWDLLEPILKDVDQLLVDIKHMEPEEHERLTGVSNHLILDNIRRFIDMGIPTRIRIPLVPNCNDSEENIRATAQFVASLASPPRVDILPYHRLGEAKFDQLGQEYALADTVPPTKQHVEHIRDIMLEYELDVKIGG